VPLPAPTAAPYDLGAGQTPVLPDPAAQLPTGAYGLPDNSAAYNQAINAALNSGNAFERTAGKLGGGQVSNQLAAGQLGVASAEEQYLLNQGQTSLGNLYNQQLAGYQLGQLGINEQQLGIQGLGLQEQQQLQGVEQPIQTSGLIGSLAAAGALNTKGSGQQQQLLGAQQQYSSEQLQNAQSQLALLSRSNGMSQQEVYNQLESMVQEGNLENIQNPVDLLNTIASITQGGLTGVENTLSPLGFAQNLSKLNPFNLFAGSSPF
jgi:hypothetical protein